MNQFQNCYPGFKLFFNIFLNNSSYLSLFEIWNLLFSLVWRIRDLTEYHTFIEDSLAFLSWSTQSHRDVLLIKQWNLCFYHFASWFPFASTLKSFVWKKNVLKEPLILSDPNLCAFLSACGLLEHSLNFFSRRTWIFSEIHHNSWFSTQNPKKSQENYGFLKQFFSFVAKSLVHLVELKILNPQATNKEERKKRSLTLKN